MKISGRHKLWIGGAVMVLLAGIIAWMVPAEDWTYLLQNALEDRNLFSAMLLFSAVYVVGTLLLLPAWMFPIAAGAAFGPGWGLLAALASSTLAALCAFLIGRHIVRDRLDKVARRNETFVAVDKAVKRDPWKVVALLRLSPVLPSGLKSYFLGLTCVDWVSYAIASAVGMLPGLAIKVALGYLGRDALEGKGPLKWAVLALGLAATIGITYFIGRVARKRLRL